MIRVASTLEAAPLVALRAHWPEYLIEGALLGVFMFVACGAVVMLEHPGSAVRRAVPRGAARRGIAGVLMGVTAIGLIYSPWGGRSGAHMNPSVTLAFLALGKVTVWDAAWYIAAQFAGGTLGVQVARAALGRRLAHPSVNHAATTPRAPGWRGMWAAWGGEFTISILMMSMVLAASNDGDVAAYTGLFAGVLVACFIVAEAPVSGMSMNPARTLASAVAARTYRGLWIYFTAPPLGMLLAAGMYVASDGHVHCAKMNHATPCWFECEIEATRERGVNRGGGTGIEGRHDAASMHADREVREAREGRERRERREANTR